jgi:hypothetical protein
LTQHGNSSVLETHDTVSPKYILGILVENEGKGQFDPEDKRNMKEVNTKPQGVNVVTAKGQQLAAARF